MRIVLDTNVFVSAVIADGVSRRALYAVWLDSDVEVVVCPALLEELDDVLRRKKFRRWISLDDAAVFVERVRREATVAVDPEVVEPFTADPTTTTSSPSQPRSMPKRSSQATSTSPDSPTFLSPPSLPPNSSSESRTSQASPAHQSIPRTPNPERTPSR